MRSGLLVLVASAASVVSGTLLQNRNAPFQRMKPVPLEHAKNDDHLMGHNISSTPTSMSDLLAQGAAIPQSASAASCSSSPNMRIEWRHYPLSDRFALISAIQCLMKTPPSGLYPPSRNRYEDFVRVHEMKVDEYHGNALLLPFHRYLLWALEQELRLVCAFDGPWPWWDVTKDAGAFSKFSLFTPTYFGPLLPEPPRCINSGAFGGSILYTGECLNRAVDEGCSSYCNHDYIKFCQSLPTFARFSRCIEGGPHAYTHDCIGGVMSDIAISPFDPAFWLVHAFFDEVWRVWENADPVRIQTIDGFDGQHNPITLDTIISLNGLRSDVRIRDIINTLGGVVIDNVPFCYRYDY